MRSNVVLLLCSDEGIENVKRASEFADNMLLEWELALDQMEKGKADVLPLLLSRVEGDVIRKFNAFGVDQFPDSYHAHPRSPRVRTVRETMKNVFHLQAVRVNDNVKVYIPEIMAVYEKFKESLSTKDETIPSATPDPQSITDTIRLTTSEDDILRHWLSPVTEAMDSERRLLESRHAEGTRQWLLEDVVNWAVDTEASRVMWLRGDAGVGKSIMAAVVASELLGRNRLGTTFFCRYNNNQRNTPRSLITTIAYGLSQWDVSLGRDLLTVQASNPNLLQEPNNVIFKSLILEPLLRLEKRLTHLKYCVIVVDALDECGAMGKRRPFLDVLTQDCGGLPKFVKVFVTGRPEPDIVEAFEVSGIPTRVLSTSHERNLSDGRICVTNRLKREAMIENPDDVEEIARIVVEKSDGLFLRIVLAVERLAEESKLKAINVEIVKDMVVNETRIYEDVFERLQKLDGGVGTSIVNVLTCAEEQLSGVAIAKLLNLDLDAVELALTCLTTVVHRFVSADGVRLVAFRHKTVADFLDESGRIERGKAHWEIGIACLRKHRNIAEFEEKVRAGVGEEVGYSAKHWVTHLMRAEILEDDIKSVKQLISEITEKKLLSWLEVLSLVGNLRIGVEAIPLCRQWLEQSAILSILPAISNSGTTSIASFKQTLPPSKPPLCKSTSVTHWDAYLSVLKGHSSSVISVMYSPDGKSIVSASDEGIIVWDSASFALEKKFTGVDITAMAFHPDGGSIAVASKERMEIRDIVSGSPIVSIECRGRGVVFSRCGSKIITGSEEGVVKVFDAKTGAFEKLLEGHREFVKAVGVSPDGRKVVTGCFGGEVRVWDLETGKCELVAKHGDKVMCGFCAGWGELSDAQKGQEEILYIEKPSVMFKGHAGSIASVVFSGDGGKLITCSMDTNVFVWDVDNGKIERVFEGHSFGVNDVSISPDGTRLVYTEIVLGGGLGDAKKRAWAFDEKRGEIFVMDSGSGKTIKMKGSHRSKMTFEGHENWVKAVGTSRDGTKAVSGSMDLSVRVWDVATGKCERVFEGHEKDVMAVMFSPSGAKIVSAGLDGTVRVWDVETGGMLSSIRQTAPAVGFMTESIVVLCGWGMECRFFQWESWVLKGTVNLQPPVPVTRDRRLSTDAKVVRFVSGG
ncbi:hypothetical protein BC829DRAFT_432357 [Chytridium lagenaria]|nr:hypothetical protein BC829DRAFT_432357 [Chytridium lagenaria]